MSAGPNREVRRLELRAAQRPTTRTVEVAIDDGPYAGWRATCRADFPARLLVELESGTMTRVLGVLEAIVLEHNLPTTDGTIAAELGDVDPYAGLLVIAARLLEAIGKLPPR